MNKNLIVITSVWCTSCLIVSNTLKQISMEIPNLNIVNFDYDLDEAQISKFNIGNTLPIMILVDDNDNEINRLTGEKSADEIKNFLLNN